jgi:hypothetical protein
MKRGLIVVVLMTALQLEGPTASASESSLGIGLGYVKAQEIDSTVWFNADFRFHVSRSFAFAPEVGYWKKSVGVLGVNASVRDLQFGVNALVVLHPTRDLVIFGGGGAAVHDIAGDLSVLGISIADSAAKGGLDVLGGIELRAGGALSFFLAARHDWLLSLRGDKPRRLDQTKFYGGFRLRF